MHGLEYGRGAKDNECEESWQVGDGQWGVLEDDDQRWKVEEFEEEVRQAVREGEEEAGETRDLFEEERKSQDCQGEQ